MSWQGLQPLWMSLSPGCRLPCFQSAADLPSNASLAPSPPPSASVHQDRVAQGAAHQVCSGVVELWLWVSFSALQELGASRLPPTPTLFQVPGGLSVGGAGSSPSSSGSLPPPNSSEQMSKAPRCPTHGTLPPMAGAWEPLRAEAALVGVCHPWAPWDRLHGSPLPALLRLAPCSWSQGRIRTMGGEQETLHGKQDFALLRPPAPPPQSIPQSPCRHGFSSSSCLLARWAHRRRQHPHAAAGCQLPA